MSENQTPAVLKNCPKCNTSKDINEFRKCAKNKDGHHLYCKPCQDQINKQYYETKKPKRLGQIKEWQKKNPEKLKVYKQNLWRKKTHEKCVKIWNPD